ncbi:MAG: hypothetical protein CMJ85_08850 [Planctomycetes bacterium]|jgi:hypothetical protein|nr:hypothetical protein [Planctomycetota bacterium]
MLRTLVLLVGLGLFATPAGAQSFTQVRTGGTLGKVLTYKLSGPTNKVFVWLPSATAGPTPLKLVDPTDPRSLLVGLDLLALLTPGVLSNQPTPLSLPLPLEFEALQHDAGIHPELDDLDGDAPPHRLALLGEEHLSHATLAEPLQDPDSLDRQAVTGIVEQRRGLLLADLVEDASCVHRHVWGLSGPARELGLGIVRLEAGKDEVLQGLVGLWRVAAARVVHR